MVTPDQIIEIHKQKAEREKMELNSPFDDIELDAINNVVNKIDKSLLELKYVIEIDNIIDEELIDKNKSLIIKNKIKEYIIKSYLKLGWKIACGYYNSFNNFYKIPTNNVYYINFSHCGNENFYKDYDIKDYELYYTNSFIMIPKNQDISNCHIQETTTLPKKMDYNFLIKIKKIYGKSLN
jgi:hypothetical protein